MTTDEFIEKSIGLEIIALNALKLFSEENGGGLKLLPVGIGLGIMTGISWLSLSMNSNPLYFLVVG